MNSGTYLDTVALLILSIFLVLVLPMVVVGSAVTNFLIKRSISLALKDILLALAGVGAVLLMGILLVAFFGMLFSGAPQQVQAIFMVFALLVPMLVTTRLLTLKRVLRYLRRLEDQNKI